MRLYKILTVVAIIIEFTVSLINCLEISLYECPCVGEDCGSKLPPRDSVVWATFVYEVHEGNETREQLATLRLKEKAAECETGEPSDKILITFLDPLNQYGLNGALHGTLENSNELIEIGISEEGILSKYSDNARGEEQFSKESYCIRRSNTTHFSVEICCGRHNSCIRKCCPHGYVFTFDPGNPCVEASTTGWSLPKMAGSSGILKDSPMKKIRTGFPDCQMMPYNMTTFLSTALTKYQLPRQPYRLYEDGTLKFLTGGGKSFETKWKTKAESIDYCVDTLSLPDEKQDMACGEDEQDVLILCSRLYVKSFSQKDWSYRIIYMVGFTISILFLLVTAIVHFLLWEKQNIHAWTILCYVLTLTGFYSCLLFIYVEETMKRWSDHYVPILSKELCIALGMITHFMGIFSFAWLSVINFDLWWTFRILTPRNQRSLDLKRLFCYAGFALTIPTVVVSIAGALQLSHEKRSEPCRMTEEDHTVYPMYGEDGCFLANFSQPYYFYLPVGALLLANLVFYICTSCQMLRIYNATRQISNRNSRKQKQSCELFLKLFLVMGTTWIFQVILSLVENDEKKWYSPIFVVLDLVNMFQAVAIFIIFVCKRETVRALEQKYFCFKSCLHPLLVAYPSQGLSRSLDGSSKMSRTELTKHSSIESTGSDRDQRRDSELIIFS